MPADPDNIYLTTGASDGISVRVRVARCSHVKHSLACQGHGVSWQGERPGRRGRPPRSLLPPPPRQPAAVPQSPYAWTHLQPRFPSRVQGQLERSRGALEGAHLSGDIGLSRLLSFSVYPCASSAWGARPVGLLLAH